MVRPRHLFDDEPAQAARTHPVLVAAGYYPGLRPRPRLAPPLSRGRRAPGGRATDGVRGRRGPRPGETQPARLSEPAGAWYDEFSNLDAPVPVRGSAELPLDETATATAWAECLVADGADVLATYDHPHLGAWAAVTTRAYGAVG